MNCKYLKIKLNRKFECKKTGKLIDIKKCNKSDCKYFEYKTHVYSLKNNKVQINKNIQLKSNSHQIKKQSYKLAKLERGRYSVFTNDLNTCCCANKDCYGSITKHELFSGRNRQRSMKHGFIIPLCEYHHSTLQEDNNFNQYWHDRCREYFLEYYGNLEEFIKTFGKSYKN